MTASGVRWVRAISRIDCCAKIGAKSNLIAAARWPGVARPRRSPKPNDFFRPRTVGFIESMNATLPKLRSSGKAFSTQSFLAVDLQFVWSFELWIWSLRYRNSDGAQTAAAVWPVLHRH